MFHIYKRHNNRIHDVLPRGEYLERGLLARTEEVEMSTMGECDSVIPALRPELERI